MSRPIYKALCRCGAERQLSEMTMQLEDGRLMHGQQDTEVLEQFGSEHDQHGWAIEQCGFTTEQPS